MGPWHHLFEWRWVLCGSWQTGHSDMTGYLSLLHYDSEAIHLYELMKWWKWNWKLKGTGTLLWSTKQRLAVKLTPKRLVGWLFLDSCDEDLRVAQVVRLVYVWLGFFFFLVYIRLFIFNIISNSYINYVGVHSIIGFLEGRK